MINTENLKDIIDDFVKIYENRPIKNNPYGTESPHLFWLFYIIKTLKPEFIIESGVYQGLSTWFIEQAAPKAVVISIDIDWNNLKYKSDKVNYTSIDFNNINWIEMLGENNCSKTLAFIDDHQDNYKRLLHAHNNKIGHMIFEDNYPTTQGDVLSLKKILMNTKYIIDTNGKKTWYDIPSEYKEEVENKCNYFECPPVYLDTDITRWNDKFEDHQCKAPLYKTVDFPSLEIFKKEQLKYGFIALCKLKYT